MLHTPSRLTPHLNNQLHQRRSMRLTYRREPKLVLRVMLLHQIVCDFVREREVPAKVNVVNSSVCRKFIRMS